MSIYKIVGGSEVYIGSTSKTLHRRFKLHISHYTHWKKGKHNFTTSFILFDKYGIDNCRIELIETFEGTKDERRRREGHFQKEIECVNMVIEGSTKKERDKAYYEKNKEAVLKYRKEWREANKEYISKKQSQKVVCECGITYTKRHIKVHLQSKKHLNSIHN